MNIAEYMQLHQVARRLWPYLAGQRPSEGDVTISLAATFPLWADLDQEPAVAVLYALKDAGQRFIPTADEGRDVIAGRQSRGWAWWQRQLAEAITAYQRAAAAAPRLRSPRPMTARTRCRWICRTGPKAYPARSSSSSSCSAESHTS